MSGNETDSEFVFPDLYWQWRDRDLRYRETALGSYRPWFYKDLDVEDESQIWRLIEKNYLLKYKDFMAVRFDWFSSGLWSIPFPGSVAERNFSNLEAKGLSKQARRSLRKWHDPLDDMRHLEDDDYFDYESSDATGLAAAKEVKRSLGKEIYLEFRPFQEIVIDNDQALELEIPAFILNIQKNG